MKSYKLSQISVSHFEIEFKFGMAFITIPDTPDTSKTSNYSSFQIRMPQDPEQSQLVWRETEQIKI